MVENGAAEVFIYTEFGDLCWHKQFENLPKGANEITYDGKDDSGSILFNGTYICLIKKKYSTKEVKDTCRLLVVK
jgi:flagellar hook assembly protein FlgD